MGIEGVEQNKKEVRVGVREATKKEKNKTTRELKQKTQKGT